MQGVTYHVRGIILRPKLWLFYVGIYTGHLCCIVKLTDEVCVSHTKRVGKIKSFYNCKSSHTCCLLVLPKNFLLMSPKMQVKRIKDGAYYCYCAYGLRIWTYSGFLWVVPTITGIFLRASKLCGENRT